MDGNDDSRTTEQEDIEVQSVVMRLALDLHPTQLTVAELIREIAGEEPGFAARDAVERAVRDLSGAGLIHRNGELLVPTRAALRLNELLDR